VRLSASQVIERPPPEVSRFSPFTLHTWEPVGPLAAINGMVAPIPADTAVYLRFRLSAGPLVDRH
jgi:hypothetical protein